MKANPIRKNLRITSKAESLPWSVSCVMILRFKTFAGLDE